MENVIKDWRGKILGYVEIKPNGDKVLKDFYRRILGYYKKSIDSTTDFYGRRLYKGDNLTMLLINK